MILNPSLGSLGAHPGWEEGQLQTAGLLGREDLRAGRNAHSGLPPQPRFPYPQRAVGTRMSPHRHTDTQPAVETLRCVPVGTGLVGGSRGRSPPARACASRRGRALPFRAGRPGRGPRGTRARLRSGPGCARPLVARESRATRAADARGGAGAGL